MQSPMQMKIMKFEIFHLQELMNGFCKIQAETALTERHIMKFQIMWKHSISYNPTFSLILSKFREYILWIKVLYVYIFSDKGVIENVMDFIQDVVSCVESDSSFVC